MGKMISVSFYFGEINLAGFEAKFGRRLEEAFPAEVEFVLRCGLMEYTPVTLRLTPDGAKCFNGVIALFYAGAVKAHLLDLSSEPPKQRTSVLQHGNQAFTLARVHGERLAQE